MIEENEMKMTNEEFLLHVRKEIANIKEILDAATKKQLKKYEIEYPETVKKIREMINFEDRGNGLKQSLKRLKMSFEIGRSHI